MTVEELIKITRTDYLNQFVEHFVSDNDLMIRSFNEAQKQACNRTDFIYDDTTASIVEVQLSTGKSTYDLSSKITNIEYIYFDNTEVILTSKHELNRTRPAWRTETEMTGKDVLAIIRGHSIRFIPAPSSTDANKTVYLEVTRMPLVDMDLSDEPEISEQFHRDLIYWVIYEAYSKNTEKQDLLKANYYLDKFTKIFGEYVSSEVRLNQLQQDKSLTLRPVVYTSKMTQTSDNDDWD